MNECECCGGKVFPIGAPYPEEQPDLKLHAANQAAHRIAKACMRERKVLTTFSGEGENLQDLLDETYRELDAAIDEYIRLVAEEE